jgi:hypothetical protein
MSETCCAVMVPVAGLLGVWPRERVGKSLGQTLQGAIESGVAMQCGWRCTPRLRNTGKYTSRRKDEAAGKMSSGYSAGASEATELR